METLLSGLNCLLRLLHHGYRDFSPQHKDNCKDHKNRFTSATCMYLFNCACLYCFFFFFFLAAILVFCRARAAVSPHLTLPHTGTNTVSTGRQRNIPTDKSLHTHTVWLEGSFLTSKLFLSRSDAHRLVLFGCVG